MSLAPADDETRRLAFSVARVLDDCRTSLAVHPRKLRELAALRASAAPAARFLPAFCTALTPIFQILRPSQASDRVARFVVAFASASASATDRFLEGFLRFLIVASAAAHRPARLRSCQFISEVLLLSLFSSATRAFLMANSTFRYCPTCNST